MPTPRLVGPCFIVLALVACGDETVPRAEVVIDTVQGVIHVTNPAQGAWSADEHWEVNEVLRLGSVEERPEEFFTNTLMAPVLGTDGNLYVVEYSHPRVMVYDRAGNFVRQIGREGRGPGEFTQPTGMAWDGYDRLWVADAWGPQYKLFTKDGSFLGTRPRAVTVQRTAVHAMPLGPSGGIVDESSASPMLYMLRVDSATGAVDTIAKARRPERPGAFPKGPLARGSALIEVAGSLLPSIHWALASDGTHWVTKTDTIRLLNVNEAGDTLRVVETSHRSPSFTPEEEELISRAVSESGLSREELGVSKEIIFGLYVLSDGHVLVQIHEDTSGPTVFDVFDPEGRYLGDLDLGFRIARASVFTSKGDTLLAVTTDSLDVPYVVRSVIDRRR